MWHVSGLISSQVLTQGMPLRLTNLGFVPQQHPKNQDRFHSVMLSHPPDKSAADMGPLAATQVSGGCFLRREDYNLVDGDIVHPSGGCCHLRMAKQNHSVVPGNYSGYVQKWVKGAKHQHGSTADGRMKIQLCALDFHLRRLPGTPTYPLR